MAKRLHAWRALRIPLQFRGHILCMREDIGRHNAFDKVVGWAILHGVDLAKRMLYSSGRVPSDMASKAIRARIPILVSKSVATDRGSDSLLLS